MEYWTKPPKNYVTAHKNWSPAGRTYESLSFLQYLKKAQEAAAEQHDNHFCHKFLWFLNRHHTSNLVFWIPKSSTVKITWQLLIGDSVKVKNRKKRRAKASISHHHIYKSIPCFSLLSRVLALDHQSQNLTSQLIASRKNVHPLEFKFIYFSYLQSHSRVFPTGQMSTYLQGSTYGCTNTNEWLMMYVRSYPRHVPVAWLVTGPTKMSLSTGSM